MFLIFQRIMNCLQTPMLNCYKLPANFSAQLFTALIFWWNTRYRVLAINQKLLYFDIPLNKKAIRS